MPPLAALLLLAAMQVSPAPGVSTRRPLDATLECLRATTAGDGRMVTINTAGGALLDLSFDTVGTNGRMTIGRIRFRIDDEGTQRRIAATAADPGDAALAAQLLQQSARSCLIDQN